MKSKMFLYQALWTIIGLIVIFANTNQIDIARRYEENSENTSPSQKIEDLNGILVHKSSRMLSNNSETLEKKGLLICSGEGDIMLELLALLHHLRSKDSEWKGSRLPVTIAHCDELSLQTQELIQQTFHTWKHIDIIDICNAVRLQNKHHRSKDRLKGFFCKPMALLHSPYTETVLIDTDVIFLQDPYKLLESTDFASTGSLFFRDRWTQTKNRLTLTGGRHTADSVYQYLQSISDRLRQVHGQRKLVSDLAVRSLIESSEHILNNKTLLAETNSYWRHFVTGKGTTLDHMQDSSIVVLDSLRQSRTLHAIRIMLKDFAIGYGDKEIYWLAATAANMNFAFEPYAPGSLGNCGALIHFDPSNLSQTSPLYINAEYLVDLNKIKVAGDFTDLDEKGLMVTLPILMKNKEYEISPLLDWRNMKHGFYPCGACSKFKCQSVDANIKESVSQSNFPYMANEFLSATRITCRLFKDNVYF